MNSDVERYRGNLRDELNGAALYTALAEAEHDPVRKDLFLQLAQAEATHAQFWRDKLIDAGLKEDAFVLPTIAAAEFADRNKYSGQADAQALSVDERGHAAVVQAVAGGSGNAPGV